MVYESELSNLFKKSRNVYNSAGQRATQTLEFPRYTYPTRFRFAERSDDAQCAKFQLQAVQKLGYSNIRKKKNIYIFGRLILNSGSTDRFLNYRIILLYPIQYEFQRIMYIYYEQLSNFKINLNKPLMQ